MHRRYVSHAACKDEIHQNPLISHNGSAFFFSRKSPGMINALFSTTDVLFFLVGT